MWRGISEQAARAAAQQASGSTERIQEAGFDIRGASSPKQIDWWCCTRETTEHRAAVKAMIANPALISELLWRTRRAGREDALGETVVCEERQIAARRESAIARKKFIQPCRLIWIGPPGGGACRFIA